MTKLSQCKYDLLIYFFFNLGFYAGNWETTSQEKIMLREENLCKHSLAWNSVMFLAAHVQCTWKELCFHAHQGLAPPDHWVSDNSPSDFSDALKQQPGLWIWQQAARAQLWARSWPDPSSLGEIHAAFTWREGWSVSLLPLPALWAVPASPGTPKLSSWSVFRGNYHLTRDE